MTFTLFEWVKEKAEELLASQPETLTDAVNKVTISDPQVISFFMPNLLFLVFINFF
jgi:hypothetical protein